MSAHTPGPWHCGGIFEPNSARPTSNVWGPTPPGMQSGNIVCCNATIPDARLIAAAPDLAEALLDLLADSDDTDVREAAVAALAKAGL
jgi:hypothetical protein